MTCRHCSMWEFARKVVPTCACSISANSTLICYSSLGNLLLFDSRPRMNGADNIMVISLFRNMAMFRNGIIDPNYDQSQPTNHDWLKTCRPKKKVTEHVYFRSALPTL